MKRYPCILKRADVSENEVMCEITLEQNLINNLRYLWRKNKEAARYIIPLSLNSAIQQGTNLPLTAWMVVPADNISVPLDPLVVLKEQIKPFFPADYGIGTPLNSIVLGFENIPSYDIMPVSAHQDITETFPSQMTPVNQPHSISSYEPSVHNGNTTDHPFDANGKSIAGSGTNKNTTSADTPPKSKHKNKAVLWTMVLLSLIAVGVIVFILTRAAYHDPSDTAESSHLSAESNDESSHENENDRTDSIINNYLRTGSYELLAAFYNQSVFQQKGSEAIDTLLIDAIDKLETDYRSGHIGYEEVTNDLSFFLSLSSDYLSDYASKKMKMIIDDYQQKISDADEVTSTTSEELSENESSVEESSDEETFVEEESSFIEELPDEQTEGHSNVNSLTIAPLSENTIRIKDIPDNKKDIKRTATQTIANTITSNKQVIDYTFRAEYEGTYRFEFQEVNDGVYYDLEVLNMSGAREKNTTYVGAGGGFTASLEDGKDYIVRVRQNQNYGSYTLLIGMQQPTTDISAYTEITDTIQFIGQKNYYSFVPLVDGTHLFEFGDMPDATYLNLYIYNSGWEKLKSNPYIRTGSGITESLTKGKTYYIMVSYGKGYGSYSLTIGHKKECVDISDYTIVADSIQYNDQKNDYYFEPKVTGTYRFEFGDMPDATYLSLYIYNSGWEKLKSNPYIRTGSGITERLTAGKKYIIQVRQSNHTGYYSLHIGHKKEWVDITPYQQITDGIQYTDQINNYSFTAPMDGKYRFEYDDVTEGTYLDLSIYNSGWEKLKSNPYIRTGAGIDISLKKDQTIFIAAVQSSKTGSYTLKIISP